MVRSGRSVAVGWLLGAQALLGVGAIAAAVPSAEGPVAERVVRQDLGGTWKIRAGRLQPAGLYDPAIEDDAWTEIAVPGNWYPQGHDLAGAVWHRKRFTLPASRMGNMVTLVFEGVDYAADVWLNGTYLGFHEGYFAPFSFDVSELLDPTGENLLAVRVDSPLERPGPSWSLNKRLIKGIFGHHDARPGGAWSARGQERNTGGIWAPVYLDFTDRVRIGAMRLDGAPGSRPADPDPDARLRVQLRLDTRVAEPTPVEVELRIEADGFSPGHPPFAPFVVPHTLQAGAQEVRVVVRCPNAALWWPWDRGQPRLYRVTATVRVDGRVLAGRSDVTGFRAVRFDEEAGRFEINGERYFVRGTNYIGTQYLASMDAARYGEDLALMRRAHVNAVRVHAHVAARGLYREADRRGLLIWQDFPLQWGYEDTPELHGAVAAQARAMVETLANHPSIVQWCGHNEPPWDADWMRHKYPHYDPEQNRQLDRDLAAVLREADPTRPVQAISSTAEHPWLGWYSGSWTDYAEPATIPWITEFGAQALPDLATLRTFLPERALWPDDEADWAIWSFHNFQRKETFELAGVAPGGSVGELVSNTQRYQSDLIRLAAESYRRQRFDPVGGIFQFMFVECWPAISWAVVDHTRRPKAGYYALQTAFQPVLPSIAWQRTEWLPGADPGIHLWVINDLRTALPDLRMTYAVRRGNEVVREHALEVPVAGDSAEQVVHVTDLPEEPGAYELVVRLEASALAAPATNRLAFRVLEEENDDAT